MDDDMAAWLAEIEVNPTADGDRTTDEGASADGAPDDPTPPDATGRTEPADDASARDDQGWFLGEPPGPDPSGRTPEPAPRGTRGLLIGRPGWPRWIRIGVLGGIIWVAAAGIVLRVDRMSAAGAAGPAPTATSVAASSSHPPPATSPVVTAAPAGAGPAAVDGPPHGDPEMVAAATLGLRQQLTQTAPHGSAYLDWALPVDGEMVSDDAAVIVLDAVWLTGDQQGYDRVHRGRWAVPVGVGGVVAGSAWLVGVAADEAPQIADPSGAHRVQEVAQAMDEQGWTRVDVVAAQPHPSVDGVVVARVRGLAPGDAAERDQVVWLADSLDGLRLLGGDERGTGPGGA